MGIEVRYLEDIQIGDEITPLVKEIGIARMMAYGAELDRKPKLDSRGIPWPLFVSLLVANGWFIKPRPFGFMSHGPSVERRAKRAVLRIPFFLAAWGIAFAQLPIAWVGLALLGWAAWLTPHIRFINKQFQTEPVEP